MDEMETTNSPSTATKAAGSPKSTSTSGLSVESGAGTESGVQGVSASGCRTSMSSFSLESGTGTESGKGASTSGCSSLTDKTRQEMLKKQRVKDCLKELRSLVKPSKDDKYSGRTLTTLQNVITQMKKYRDEASDTPNVMDSELTGSAQDGDDIDWLPSSEHRESFKVVTSMKDNVVLQVPCELLRMLRYPNDHWFNQSLMDYIYACDVATVNTHLPTAHATPNKAVIDTGRESATDQKDIFFFRIRHYKGIQHDSCLSRSEKYSVFCGQAKWQKVDLKFPPGQMVQGLQQDKIYPVLECIPIQSSYTSEGILPPHASFTMGHTVHCQYIFTHPSSIPLTGYLPQEVIGTSIFDYYHPQDLLILLGIYQKIAAMPGQTFRSIPYRMRIKNGDYIRLETEWMNSVNPLTGCIDTINCKHNIVQGPRNLDVFKDCPMSKQQSLQASLQALSLQRHIKATLLQMAQQPQSEVDVTPLVPAFNCPAPQRERMAESDDPMSTEPTEQLEEDYSDVDKLSTNTLERDKLLIYEQLNYAQNIRRFLLSCPASLQGKSSSEYNTESDGTDQDEITVDLALPKPPSFGSSTKALVSEREHLEEMPPSPAHEDISEALHTKTDSYDDVYQPVPLTEDAIAVHNRQQRQQYIEKMVPVGGKSNLVTVQIQGLEKQTGKARKRKHPRDEDESQKGSQYRRTSRKDLLEWCPSDLSQSQTWEARTMLMAANQNVAEVRSQRPYYDAQNMLKTVTGRPIPRHFISAAPTAAIQGPSFTGSKWTISDIEESSSMVMKADQSFPKKMGGTADAVNPGPEPMDHTTPAKYGLHDEDELLSSAAKSTNQPSNTCHRDQREGDEEAVDPSAPASGQLLQSQQEKNASDCSDEAVSKDLSEMMSSDLTPSDQRSNDDQPSSVKESDNNSSSDGQSMTPNNAQSPTPDDNSDHAQKFPVHKDLQKFVPMQFLSKSSWLQDISFHMNELMQYRKPLPPNIDDLLASDLDKLKTMLQPQMVETQLEELMVQLKTQIIQALDPGPCSQGEHEEGLEGTSD